MIRKSLILANSPFHGCLKKSGLLQKQVNTALTLRNWIIGFYIVEYEQHGNDRVVYGQRLYKEIAANLKNRGVTSLRERHLYICKDFYKAYSDILRTPSAKLYLSDSHGIRCKQERKLGKVCNLRFTAASICI
ncbi:DUF1016 N-terminal domain-containing protein [Chitinophaga filiformis]|uniref:DUF1016 N-terminal domain-containing protein n=1 Tax=Chitinophaga filiformis TaxID=104663 RepID=UPI0039784018